MKLTQADIARYAPYHTFPEFKQGYEDYANPGSWQRYKDTDGVGQQAYDRGAECAMRHAREARNSLPAYSTGTHAA